MPRRPARPAKVDPETLVLKAAPRRVARFKRRVVIGVAAVACVAVFAATWIAFQGPAWARPSARSSTIPIASGPRGTGRLAAPMARCAPTRRSSVLRCRAISAGPCERCGSSGSRAPIWPTSRPGRANAPGATSSKARKRRILPIPRGLRWPLVESRPGAGVATRHPRQRTPSARARSRRDPNDQQRKLDFLNPGRGASTIPSAPAAGVAL